MQHSSASNRWPLRLAAATAALLAAACSRSAGNGAGPAAVKAVPVVVAAARQTDLGRTVLLSGKVAAVTEVAVASKIPGRIAEVRVELGQPVKKGDLLVALENGELAAQVQQARAGVATAGANLVNARANFDRMQNLLRQGAISQQQFEQARLALATAEAQVQQAEAALQLAQTNYQNSLIHAPADGVIGQRAAQPGGYASPGVPLLTVVDLNRMVIEGTVGESDINRVQTGQSVAATVPAIPGQTFPGKVVGVSPSADPRTRNFTVRVELDNASQALKSGMYAEVALVTDQRPGVTAVPLEAVVERDGAKAVFVVQDDKAALRKVELGVATQSEVEVKAGVKPGEQVVVAGQNLLFEGAPVLVQTGGK